MMTKTVKLLVAGSIAAGGLVLSAGAASADPGYGYGYGYGDRYSNYHICQNSEPGVGGLIGISGILSPQLNYCPEYY